MPISQINTEFKISCQQLLKIHISKDSSPTDLEETSPRSIFQIVHNGQFTGRDYDGTKCDGWFGPKHIDLYLSWLLLTNKIPNKSLEDIMILPYTIFQEFEDNNKHKTDDCTSAMYDQLVEKEKRNIFDTSLYLYLYTANTVDR